MKILCVSLILMILCMACADQEPTPVILSVDSSAGGGFTGGYSGVSLEASGLVSQYSGGPNMPLNTSPIKTIDAKDVKRIMSLAVELRSYNYFKPSNWTYSITIHTARGDHTITWSSYLDIDPKVLKLHEELGLLLR